jgi:hypothetical protein
MYIISRSFPPSQLRRSGLAEPRDTSDRGKSLEAIRKALQLNPVGGYVKGSSARRKLDDALKSVPITSALEVFNQLKTGVGPLGRLFQYRLHDQTKPIVLDILWSKHLEQQKQLKDAQEILKNACELQKQSIEKHRVALKNIEDSVEQICKSTGEDSDTCLKARFTLLEAKTRLEDAIRTHGARCP